MGIFLRLKAASPTRHTHKFSKVFPKGSLLFMIVAYLHTTHCVQSRGALHVKEKIKELLGLNLPNNVVASAIGVSEGYISQLLSDDIFKNEVSELRIKNTLEHAHRDKKYDSLEDRMLEKLEEKLDGSLSFTKSQEILAAIKVLNGAKRRAAPAELNSQAATPGMVLNLHLPESAAFAAKFIVNGENQVIEIAGKSVATMSAKGVLKQLEDMHRNTISNEAKLPEAQNDEDKASEARLAGLLKLEELPVADLL